MDLKIFVNITKIVTCSLLVFACQGPNLSLIENKVQNFSIKKSIENMVGSDSDLDLKKRKAESLSAVVKDSSVAPNAGKDFVSILSVALSKDPVVVSKKRSVDAKLAAIKSKEAQKDYTVTSTIYGGLEDISDNTKGIAVGINASRLIFDGGMLDSQIASSNFEAEAAELQLRAVKGERAYKLAEIWLELEKYESLKSQIDERLSVLDPLIQQLERVAKAGLGDASKVAAAQRTVSAIRVTQTNVYEGYAKAKLEFTIAYGEIDDKVTYDASYITNLLPNSIEVGVAQKSPALLAKYAIYKAAVENVAAVKAKDEFSVGFEARAMRPFAGSGYDSDESVGFVARKTLFNGGMLESEVREAEAMAQVALAETEVAYKEGTRMVQSALQTIDSMNGAIHLARDNSQIASDEISYLRKQLVIGGSTLESVLSAEARLYEAVSKEINFTANRRKAELVIASALGLLDLAFDF